MKKITTKDGSHTLYNPQIKEHYHSMHGAYTESKHVFVHSGLAYYVEQNKTKKVKILEVGFGTGLNLLTTMEYIAHKNLSVDYTGIEAYPLSLSDLKELDHGEYVQKPLWSAFLSSYESALQAETTIHHVSFQICPVKLLDFTHQHLFDVVYFDAFSEIHQPEMWTEEVLSKITHFMKRGSVFVTYAITGNLKRRLKKLGFEIQKLPGAPGKREMLRAVKEK
ncbi:MAG TPA: tRNA (5-methylaminomethyl-2-thiouridine)(34)-methyltransferase MnmD [Sphingobacterium sp.]|nr:tRNA (5-methylaminomethyl-2-thiouridine)(34)-methyltransferase MnmD [Sphingobacterium sp.]